MKRCCRCRRDLPVESFSIDKRKKDQLRIRCRECDNKCSREQYAKNKSSRIEDAIQYKKNVLSWINSLKDSGVCVDCGVSFVGEPFLMEFDHLKDKSMGISDGVRKLGWSIQRVQEEIAKCELVCVLCHRLRTKTRIPFGPPPSIGALRQRRIRQSKRDIVNARKQHPCVCCGKQYDTCQMDLDHIDSILKTDKLSNMVGKRTKIEISNELSKCQVLCAICHKRKHAAETS